MAKIRTLPGLAGVDAAAFWNVGALTPCFYCTEPVGAVAVYWHGVGAESGDSGTIALHSRCAVRLAQHLGMDAEREATPPRLERGETDAMASAGEVQA